MLACRVGWLVGVGSSCVWREGARCFGYMAYLLGEGGWEACSCSSVWNRMDAEGELSK